MARRAVVPGILLGWLLLAASAGRAEAPSPPAPQLKVSLEREELRAKDAVVLRFWLINTSPIALDKAKLRFRGPNFLRLMMADCDTPSPEGGLLLDDVGGYSVAQEDLCLTTTGKIREGDFTVVFEIGWDWKQGASAGSSVMLVEKTVQVGLFDNESLGGGSLRLGAYIIPGLLFWLVLRLTSVIHKDTFTPFETAYLSVVASLGLAAVASAFSPEHFEAGLSLLSFSLLCLLASGLALLVWIFVAAGRWVVDRCRRRRSQAASWIEADDDESEALVKLLTAPGEISSGPVTVELSNGEKWLGALAGETSDDGIALLGWFSVDAGDNAGVRSRLAKLFREGKFGKAAKLARKEDLEFRMEDSVKQLVGGEQKPTYRAIRRFPREQVVHIKRTPGDSSRPPLSLLPVAERPKSSAPAERLAGQ